MPSDEEVKMAACAIMLQAGGHKCPEGINPDDILNIVSEWARNDVLEKARLALEAAERVRN